VRFTTATSFCSRQQALTRIRLRVAPHKLGAPGASGQNLRDLQPWSNQKSVLSEAKLGEYLAKPGQMGCKQYRCLLFLLPVFVDGPVFSIAVSYTILQRYNCIYSYIHVFLDTHIHAYGLSIIVHQHVVGEGWVQVPHQCRYKAQ